MHRNLVTYSDSDWAACTQTRRSTKGGIIFIGGHPAKHWTKLQTSIALSSGEAELYAAVKLASEMMGVKSLMGDLGLETGSLKVHVDAKATIGMVSRLGLGSVKHIQASELWIQDAVRRGCHQDRESRHQRKPRRSDGQELGPEDPG